MSRAARSVGRGALMLLEYTVVVALGVTITTVLMYLISG
jgi:hypothetical protein